MEHTEIVKERYSLSMERIREIREEEAVASSFAGYFRKTADFLLTVGEVYEELKAGRELSLEECREPVFADGEHQRLYQEVMALPAKYRLPLYLYYYEGYTAPEVGALLGLKPSTVQTRLARAREKLRAQLREE